MFSIFHFFGDLIIKRKHFLDDEKLERFPFDDAMLSCKRRGRFPDLAIRINPTSSNNPFLTGGELIELKNSTKSYSIASFNSTIPTGTKHIADLVTNGTLGEQMSAKGDDVNSLPLRQVYYLLRGHRGDAVKVCLLHGSFFETVGVDDLVSSAFQQVVGEVEDDDSPSVPKQRKYKQRNFSAVRHVDRASVSLRFRVMTEARKEANILSNYKAIKDNTLNLIVPLHANSPTELEQIAKAAKSAGILRYSNAPSTIKHPFNGYFWVLAVDLIP